MYCDEALDAVEAVAAGELTPDGRLAAHYTSCPNCATALATARKLEALLKERAAPTPPPQFTTRTLSRVRRARWRSEQMLDAGFNTTIAVVVLAVVIGGWSIINRSGATARPIVNEAIGVLGSGLVSFVREVAPSFPLYAGATALLATALGIWWWAERGAFR
jgi:anti-sigma factor RsiW